MDIEAVARRLYGLPPQEFTRARNASAAETKATGDVGLAKRITALRKPTTGAWLLNQLVRHHEAEVREVVDLGARLRAAQGTLAAEELRALDRRRRELTHEMARRTEALAREAGQRVSAPALTTVEETLRSAMIDAAAGAALATGLLVDTFALTGLEPLDATQVLAVPELLGSHPSDSPPPVVLPAQDSYAEREERLDEAQRALEDARLTARRAEEQAESATRGLDAARSRHDDLKRERDALLLRLHDLGAELAAAEEAEQVEARRRDDARAALTAATAVVDELRVRLTELRRG